MHQGGDETQPAEEAPVAEAPAPETPAEEAAVETAPKTRRRPRARKVEAAAVVVADETPVVVELETIATEAPAKPKRARRAKAAEAPAEPVEASAEPIAEATIEAPAEKPKRTRARKAAAQPAEPVVEVAIEAEAAEDGPVVAETEGTPRRGWWQRTFGE